MSIPLGTVPPEPTVHLAPTTSKMQIRVLSWNIHKGVGGLDRRYRLERVVELLRERQPDIVMLQEVAQFWPGAKMADQVAELCEELDLNHHAFGHEHRYRRGGYGNLTLSRFPIRDTRHFDLTISWRKKRGALVTRVLTRDTEDGEEHQHSVWVANLHLGLSGSERAEQLRRFLSLEPFGEVQRRTPAIVAGDLNDLYGNLGPLYLEPAGFRRAGALTRTFPAFAPLRPLDGIFFRGSAELQAAGIARGPKHREASDHLPLEAVFEIPKHS